MAIKKNGEIGQRDQFLKSVEGQQIDLDEVKHHESLRIKGVDLARADLNHDGRIEGSREFNELFSQVNRLDGSKDTCADLLETKRAKGAIDAVENYAARPAAPEGAPGYDPYAPRVYMAKGPSRNEPIDLSEKRSIEIVTKPDEIARYGGNPKTEIVVANVFHQGQFWVARIPKDAVDDVITQDQRKKGLLIDAFHEQLRFDFKKGKEAILIPQRVGQAPTTDRLSSLVISVEATGGRDYDYGAIKGVTDGFAVAVCARSLEAAYERGVIGYNNDFKQYRIRFNKKTAEADKQNVLMQALLRGTREGTGGVFNMLTNACITGAFGFIDRAVGTQYNWFQRLLVRTIAAAHIPWLTRLYLQARGLLSWSNPPPLRKEFSSVQDVHMRTSRAR